jgi:hypothetical protein
LDDGGFESGSFCQTLSSGNLVWGTSLQFSMPYLRSSVIDLGLPDFINHLIPIFESQFAAPIQNHSGNGLVITGTFNPGGDGETKFVTKFRETVRRTRDQRGRKLCEPISLMCPISP